MSSEMVGPGQGWYPAQQPAQPVWVPELVIGDIEVNRYWVRTPVGVVPTAQAHWSVTEQRRSQRFIPGWAIFFAVIFALACLLGLLFLLVKEERLWYDYTVTVHGPGFSHSTVVTSLDPRAGQDLHARVAQARALASLA